MMEGVDVGKERGKVGKWGMWMGEGSMGMVEGKKERGEWIRGVGEGKYMEMVGVGNLKG